MIDNINENKIENLSDKSNNNNEVYEQKETDNLDIELIQKKKNIRKYSYSSEENKVLSGFCLSILLCFLSFWLFICGIKMRIDRYATNKKFRLIIK